MDIIILGAIAVFIFIKFRQQLGKVDEDQKREAIKKFIKEKTNIAVTAELVPNGSVDLQDAESTKILDTLEVSLKENVVDILAKFQISASFFIEGSKKAFEMVVEAFAASDSNPQNLSNLKSLLSEKVYEQFAAAIKQRIAEKKDLISKIISINSAVITEAKIVKNQAFVTVRIVSSQINYIVDADGAIIEGDRNLITEVTDYWTFKKDLSEKNTPNWLISSTSTS